MAQDKINSQNSDNDITYSGPPKEYVPHIGDNWQEPPSRRSQLRRDGYFDIDWLREALATIRKDSRAIISSAENGLETYNMIIQPGSAEDGAQDVVWPKELGDKNGVVSYDQYKYAKAVKGRAADVIQKSYEQNMRGPSGSNFLDAVIMAEYLIGESTLIEKFLDNYIAVKPNNTAEYRAIELFQDWASNSLQITSKVKDLISTRVPDTGVLSSEISKLTAQQAREYQSIFQVQVTSINRQIEELQGAIESESGVNSSIFYNKFLGPSVRFHKRVGKGLEDIRSDSNTIGSEISQVASSMRNNLEVILTDQIRRNKIFRFKTNDIIDLISKRDKLNNLISQMGSKGTQINERFNTSLPVDVDKKAFFESATIEAVSEESSLNPYASPHNILDGRYEADAHPQYLLSDGDVLGGQFIFSDDIDDLTDIYTDPEGHNLVFDGMRPRYHRHRGLEVDGTEKLIASESIADGTLTSNSVDSYEDVCIPSNLRLLEVKSSASEDGKVDIEIGFDCHGDEFEIQIVPLIDREENVCLVGHLGQYPITNGAPHEDPRVYLNVGDDIGVQQDTLPLIPLSEDLYYDVTKTFSIALNNDIFIVCMDSNDSKDIEIKLCKRNHDDVGILEYSELTAITIASSDGGQGTVCGCRVDDTTVLLGLTQTYGGVDYPTVKLVTYKESDSNEFTVEVVAEAKLLDGAEFSSTNGVSCIDYNQSGNLFVASFLSDNHSSDPDAEHNNRSRYVSGNVFAGSQARISVNDFWSAGSGYGEPYSMAKILNDGQFLCLFGEPVENPYRDIGYYIFVQQYEPGTGTVSEYPPNTITQVADSGQSGLPNIEVINDSEFLFVWIEDETSYSATNATTFVPGLEGNMNTSDELEFSVIEQPPFTLDTLRNELLRPLGNHVQLECDWGAPTIPSKDVERTSINPNGNGIIIGDENMYMIGSQFIDFSSRLSGFNWINASSPGQDSVIWAQESGQAWVRLDEVMEVSNHKYDDISVVILNASRRIDELDKNSSLMINRYKDELNQILSIIEHKFTSVKVVYVSTRMTGRFSSSYCQEPSSFNHIAATLEVVNNYSGQLNLVCAPLLWDDGACVREDGFYVERNDFGDDGYTVSSLGAKKYALHIADYLSNQSWFNSGV